MLLASLTCYLKIFFDTGMGSVSWFTTFEMISELKNSGAGYNGEFFPTLSGLKIRQRYLAPALNMF